MKPGDLVGAITGETGLDRGAVGAIRLVDSYALVEVDDRHASRIVAALKNSTIRGQKVPVRRERT